jgi:LPXTG-site transpeptidase (sortase) family protein
MVRRVLNHLSFYRTLGTSLLSAGIVLVCLLSSRFVREEVDAKVAQRTGYLCIASMPTFALPPATPIPTFTPTPTPLPTPVPTATPVPSPAIRLLIPAIDLNISIQETSPIRRTSWTGAHRLIWAPVSFAVGHYNTSGYPGEGQNIVLAGHNNTQGAVFRRLDELMTGDEVILFTEDESFYYRVQEKTIIPYLWNEAEADERLQFYAAPKPTEMVTLISCWPYATNANRIVVIAVPAQDSAYAP